MRAKGHGIDANDVALMGPGALLFWLAVVGWVSTAHAQTTPRQWVSQDPATKVITFTLAAGVPGTAGPFNFNGYTSGAATLVVPAKSTVVMNFVNEDYTPHSAVVAADKDPMPNMGGDAAIPRAYTKDLIQGLPQGGKDFMRFAAPGSGSFRIICGVPGHALSGMWIRLTVDPSATAPSWKAP